MTPTRRPPKSHKRSKKIGADDLLARRLERKQEQMTADVDRHCLDGKVYFLLYGIWAYPEAKADTPESMIDPESFLPLDDYLKPAIAHKFTQFLEGVFKSGGNRNA